MDIEARINKSMEMIGQMCKDGRPPKMSIPAQPSDEDIFISETLKLCFVEISRLKVKQIENQHLLIELKTCLEIFNAFQEDGFEYHYYGQGESAHREMLQLEIESHT